MSGMCPLPSALHAVPIAFFFFFFSPAGSSRWDHSFSIDLGTAPTPQTPNRELDFGEERRDKFGNWLPDAPGSSGGRPCLLNGAEGQSMVLNEPTLGDVFKGRGVTEPGAPQEKRAPRPKKPTMVVHPPLRERLGRVVLTANFTEMARQLRHHSRISQLHAT